jgi:predicted RNase H-like nuclease (RuvC/YqgF family)
MAKILLGIALAVMLGTAALGFLAKGNIDKLQSTLASTKSTLVTTQGTLRTTQGELKKTQDDLTAANTKIEEKDKEIATMKGQVDDLTKQITEAKAALDEKTNALAALQKKLDDIIKNPAGGTVDPAELAKQIEQMKADLTKAQTEVAESKSLIDALTKKKQEVEAKAADLEKYKTTREGQLARPGLSGRILAVNAGWNFVVLSVGDKQGAVMNAPMLVVRGNEAIAKARISSVEPTTSIADIIPGSVRRGVTIQPGDTIIFEGRNPVTQPQPGGNTPAAAGTGPALPSH